MQYIIQTSPKRSGSTFLKYALNSHPDIKLLEEIFVNKPKHPPSDTYLKKWPIIPYKNYCKYYGKISPNEYLYKILNSPIHQYNKVIGLKVMYNQFNISFPMELLKNYKIINLRRKNLIKKIISEANAHKTDFFVIKELTPTNLFHRVQSQEKFEKFILNKIQRINNNFISLWYEDIIGETIEEKTYINSNINKIICDYLNVKNIPMYSLTKKKNTYSMFDYLPDKQGTINIFKNTKYEWMLSDE